VAALVCAVALCPSARGASEDPPVPTPSAFSTELVGGVLDYEVQTGDSLTLVSARFGVDVAPLARANGLEPGAWLQVGQWLRIDNRHVVPGALGDGIWINVPQRMLFRVADGETTHAFPVGLGRASWRTPLGGFEIRSRQRDKTWVVPASIQREMRRAGKPVRTRVPPGPGNPLGGYWLGLSGIACGIHGTTAPASVYRFQTHGCIRAGASDIESLFAAARVGDPVSTIYLPVLLASAQGRIWLESHTDVYGRGRRFAGAGAPARRRAGDRGLDRLGDRRGGAAGA
jgi:L,D-transpeptidase ErfK/SrfK